MLPKIFDSSFHSGVVQHSVRLAGDVIVFARSVQYLLYFKREIESKEFSL